MVVVTVERPQLLQPAMILGRNRIAHGYFDIELNVVWNTVQEDLPVLVKTLPGIN